MDHQLQWEVNPINGCVTCIKMSGIHISIMGWGTELSDRYSFFSQEKLGGKNSQIIDKKITIEKESITSNFVLKFKTAFVRISLNDKIEQSRIQRKYILETLEDSYLADFVIRTVFPKDIITKVFIMDKKFDFQSSNLYRQYKTDAAILETQRGLIESRVQIPISQPKFDLVTYVRDEPPDKWVVHHRLLSSKQQLPVLQCYKFIINERLCPLLRWHWFREKFWLYSEEKNNKLPFTFQVATNSFLPKGEKLEMFSTLIFYI